MISKTGDVIGKKDIARHLAKVRGISFDEARENINVILDAICRSVAAGNQVKFNNFGIFRPRHTRERVSGFHARTGKPLAIPASVRFSFKTARSLSDLRTFSGYSSRRG